jgi:Family of unknown function (DUF6204)
MKIEAQSRTFRVTVRGQFHELSEATVRYLKTTSAEHDLFVSKFTSEGTFSYDDRLDSFNLRFELQAAGPEAEAEVKAQALLEAELFLNTLKIGFKRLRAAAMDMSAMWDSARR